MANLKRVSKITLVLLLCLSLLFGCLTVPSYAIVGVDDVVLFTALGLLCVACGYTLPSTQSIVDYGRNIALTLGSDLDLIKDWVLNWFSVGTAKVTGQVLQVLQKYFNYSGVEATVNAPIRNEIISTGITTDTVSLTASNYSKSGDTLEADYIYSVNGRSFVTHVSGGIVDSSQRLATYNFTTHYYFNGTTNTISNSVDFNYLNTFEDSVAFALSSNFNLELGWYESQVNTLVGETVDGINFGLMPTFISSASGYPKTWQPSHNVAFDSGYISSGTFIPAEIGAWADYTSKLADITWFDTGAFDYAISSLDIGSIISTTVRSNQDVITDGVVSLPLGTLLTFPDGLVISSSGSLAVDRDYPLNYVDPIYVSAGNGEITPQDDGTSKLRIPILSNLLDFLQAILNTLGTIYNKFVDFLTSIVNKLTSSDSTLVNIYTKLTDIASRIGSTVSTDFTVITSAISNGITNIITDIGGRLSSIGSTLSNGITSIGNYISTGVSNIITDIGSKVTGVGTTLTDIFTQVKAIAQALAGSVVDVFANLGTLWSDVIGFVSGYTLYNSFFSHFLPYQVAVFFWLAWEISLILFIIRFILDR